MIEIRQASKRFGSQTALQGLDLNIAPGEVYSLLGANGAGKTTTIKLLLGFLQPDAGSLRVAGLDPVQQPEAARARVAYIPEQVSLYPTLSGAENLCYFAALAGCRLDPADTLELLGRAGLGPEASERRLADYSKGMRQKVGIAIALAKRAEVLLLDEPLSGLDPLAANEFAGLVRGLAEGGATVLMATHDLFRARQMSDRLGILRGGHKLAELRAAELDAGQLQDVYLQHMQG